MKPKNRATTPATTTPRAPELSDDDDTPVTPLPSAAPTDPESEIGASYTLELQKHAQKPLYRLRERSVAADGSVTARTTPWSPFSAWTPELLLARKRLQDFVFSGDPRMPRAVELSRRS